MKLVFDKHDGPIFCVEGDQWWNKSHAQVPVPLVVDDKIRIYYASRADDGMSRISFLEVLAEDPSIISYVHQDIICDLGQPGAFDDSGMMPTCVMTIDAEVWLYYIGWTKSDSVPYENAVGLLRSTDGVSFERVSAAPILSKSEYDPYFVGTCWVDSTEDCYVAYYLSCTGWHGENPPEATYDIKEAKSSDGQHWQLSGRVILANDSIDEAIASVTIIDSAPRVMLYCSRSTFGFRDKTEHSYRLRSAVEQEDGTWMKTARRYVMEPGEDGEWDCDMQAYPYAISVGERNLMFYNGNGFGKSGIGFAEVYVA